MGVFVNAAQRLFQVMAGDIGKGVKLFVALCQVGIQPGQMLGAQNDQFHDQRSQPRCGVHLDR